ncbi:MAG: glycerophosphodiester phosphodiesterase [Chloroflexi bacterium]|nr:glycerophosphodiester phosphodiesterase [Chloroflexota bacterium]
MALAKVSYRDALKRGRPLLVAHRGAAGSAPENTMAAFELALNQGADAIELDVHLSKDGVPVIIHDHTLERTSNGKGLVAWQTVRELRELDAGAWFRPQFAGQRLPTLEEFLAWARGRVYVKVEIKNLPTRYQGIEERVIGLLSQYEMVGYTEVFSFDHHCVRRVGELCPEVVRGVCYVGDIIDHVAVARWAGALVLHPHWSAVRPELVAAAHKAGSYVDAWTVNEMDVAQRLAMWGVDCIKTDYPDLLLETLVALGLRP